MGITDSLIDSLRSRVQLKCLWFMKSSAKDITAWCLDLQLGKKAARILRSTQWIHARWALCLGQAG